jgi:hypothetical protein
MKIPSLHIRGGAYYSSDALMCVQQQIYPNTFLVWKQATYTGFRYTQSVLLRWHQEAEGMA